MQTNTRRPKIRQLIRELYDLVAAVPEFSERAWSIYDLEDLSEKSQFAGFPVVGIAYEGTAPADQSASSAGNFKSAAAQANQRQCQAAALLEQKFSIIVGIEYNPTGNDDGTDDNKAVATDLLDEIRAAIIGYKGVNTRPWLLEGEAPTGSEIEGVIWYGQIWKTTVPVLSQHR